MTSEDFLKEHPQPPQSWEGLKKLAKRLKKSQEDMQLSEAQELVAKHCGYRNFHHAGQVLNKDNP